MPKTDNPPAQRWVSYATGICAVHDISQRQFCERIGLGSAAWTHWTKLPPEKRFVIRPETAENVSKAFDRPIIEVYIAAGYGTAEDYGVSIGRGDASTIPNSALLAELSSRLRPDDERSLPPAPDTEAKEGEAPKPVELAERKTRRKRGSAES